MAKSLAEKLHNQDHLREDELDEETLAQLVQNNTVNPEEEAAKEETEEAELADPRLERVYSFDFDFTPDRGMPLRGKFVNHALNVGDQGRVGVAFSGLNGGQPLNSIPRDTALLHQAIAHMSFSLKERPKWAKNLAALDDPDIIYALFAEVAEHQRIFLGRPSASEEGEG